MPTHQDHYSVLGVRSDSEDEVIRAAYRALMLKYHPDTSRSPEATVRASRINEAFTVLGDRKKRADYDAQRRVNTRTSQASPPPPPPKPPPPAKPAASASENSKSQGQEESENDRAMWPWIVGGLAVLAAIGLAQTPLPNAAEDTAAMEVNAADAMEGLTNDVANVAGSTVDVSIVDPLSNTLDIESGALPQVPTALSFTDIEFAAASFERELRRSGMAGARAWSQKCHKEVGAGATWSAADRCAAFDFAARYVDVRVAANGGWAESAYFKFQADNQAEQYRSDSILSFSVTSRLSRIKAAVEPAVVEMVSAGIARRERAAIPSPTEQVDNSNAGLALPDENAIADE